MWPVKSLPFIEIMYQLYMEEYVPYFCNTLNCYRKLAGKTLFITGASRGIGKCIALRAAKDGANIVIAAKTATPHPKLPGTIYTAAKESRFDSYTVSLQ